MSTPTRGLGAVIAPWVAGSTLVAVVVLVVVLVAGGGAPEVAPGGLPDAGALTGWGLPVLRLLVDLAGFATVGLTLVASRVIHVEPAAPDDALSDAGRVAAVWAALATLQALLQISELMAAPLVSADPDLWARLTGALSESTEAQAMLAQAALAAVVVWSAGLSHKPSGSTATLVVAMLAFVPAALVGHAATGNRVVGSLSLVVHVGAAALWVGGLAALAWAALRGRTPLANAIPRYSALALWCVLAVAVSGTVNAAVRIGSLEGLFGSAYGIIVLAKVAALAVLAWFGWLHRQHTVEHLRAWRKRRHVPAAAATFIALAAVELAVMAATIALAVGLSRTPPPSEAQASPGTSTAAIAFNAAAEAQPRRW